MTCFDSPTLGNPPHGHGGGGHGGHGHGGFHGRPFFRGGRGRGPWPWVYEPAYRTDTTCTSWALPVPMTPDLHTIGTRLLTQSGWQPTSAYHNGVLYLFSWADGVISVRPCAAVGVLGDSAGYYLLYKTQDNGQSWAQMGDWATLPEAQDRMTAALVADPNSRFGAYVTDGESTPAWYVI